MTKFVPYEKLSKKRKRELDALRRSTWGDLNPVTRKPAKPQAYNRQKARKWDREDLPTVPSGFLPKTKAIRYVQFHDGHASKPMI